jgi:CDP-glucose 4,6-dehydratase
VEDLVMFSAIYHGKVVWLSGHTGFKGGWLAAWLKKLGARVHGFSLPSANPSFFQQTGLEHRLEHEVGDVRDLDMVKNSIDRVQPDFVFHLAAQALVRHSYEIPLETYSTNIMGTANVLEALRALNKPCAAVCITTDKCYENRETDYAYSEEDNLGGHDPYSSSKAAAELVISAYRRSFFGKLPVLIASARAGNVIGGGDWARDRIVPDCIRSLQHGETVPVRNPAATRPWQHVLEPLSGYLWLGAALMRPELAQVALPEVATAFNFGPEKEANRPVADLVREVLKSWPGKWEDRSDPHAFHEAKLLMLSTARARRVLKWNSAWLFETAVARTVGWYRGAHEDPGQAWKMTLAQIEEYEQAAGSQNIKWATI